MPNRLIVYDKIGRFNKVISVSGDNSISIRWVLLSSLANGVSNAKNLLLSEDVLAAIRAIRILGIKSKITKKGFKIYLIFIIQRNDFHKFDLAKDIDPEYCEFLEKAVKKKLKLLCYDCKFSSKGIKLNRDIQIEI